MTPLSDAQKVEILWQERAERQGVVKALRLGQLLAAIAVSLLTFGLAVRGLL